MHSDRYRTVSLLRHAKSSWRERGLPDHDRPLNERGKRAAALMGDAMLNRNLIPDLVLCSSAARARMTWDLVSEMFPEAVPVQVEKDLYLAAPRTVLDTVRGIAPEVRHVLIVGHNPTMQALALVLTETSSHPARTRIWQKYPTGALTVIRVHWPDWYSAGDGESGDIAEFIRPRDLEKE
ncbi:MAG: histidine phosphatase family protein [Gemmatimonadota bacterium]